MFKHVVRNTIGNFESMYYCETTYVFQLNVHRYRTSRKEDFHNLGHISMVHDTKHLSNVSMF